MRTAVLITVSKLGATPVVELRTDVVQAKADFKKAVAAGKGAELWLSDGGRVRRQMLKPEGLGVSTEKGRGFAEGQAEALKQPEQPEAPKAPKVPSTSPEPAKAGSPNARKKPAKAGSPNT